MTALALTDHGNLYGAIEFYQKATKAGIKPILGVDFFVAPRTRHDKEHRIDDRHSRLVLLARNETGYRNLMLLVSRAHLEGFYYKPRVDWEILEKYHEGLIATSSCPQGEIPWLLGKGEVEKAEERLKEYLRIFGDDYYIELQRHDGLENLLKPLNEQLLVLSRKYGIPLIATNDVHYVRKDDARAQDALLAIQTRTTLDDKNRFTMIDSPTFYFKSQDEMSDLFSDLPEALTNTRKIVDKVDLIIPTGKMIYPKYPVPEGSTPEAYLRQLVMEKLPDRYPSFFPNPQQY
jgi:DNA polymerase-3 subunit alpha